MKLINFSYTPDLRQYYKTSRAIQTYLDDGNTEYSIQGLEGFHIKFVMDTPYVNVAQTPSGFTFNKQSFDDFFALFKGMHPKLDEFMAQREQAKASAEATPEAQADAKAAPPPSLNMVQRPLSFPMYPHSMMAWPTLSPSTVWSSSPLDLMDGMMQEIMQPMQKLLERSEQSELKQRILDTVVPKDCTVINQAWNIRQINDKVEVSVPFISWKDKAGNVGVKRNITATGTVGEDFELVLPAEPTRQTLTFRPQVTPQAVAGAAEPEQNIGATPIEPAATAKAALKPNSRLQ